MELWLKAILESNTCEKIMDELENWRYDAGSDQTVIEL